VTDNKTPPPNPAACANAADFIAFARKCGALRFGEFQTRSGRVSPYFFDAGKFASGGALLTLAKFYRAAIAREGLRFDMLFGPAYKGIALACAVAFSLAEEDGIDAPVAFNRKEEKDHGEGGNIIGAKLAGRALIVDDVITAGGSIAQAAKTIKAHNATPAGVVVALNRMERGKTAGESAAQTAAAQGIKIAAVADLNDVSAHLIANGETDKAKAIAEYRKRYGAD
jgi:orotate phosphoribosyltransferase